MKVIIDNTDDKKTYFYFKIGGRWSRETNTASGAPLIVRLEKALKKRKKNFDNIGGIAVVVGRGRFTAARIAATLGNTLSFANKVPIIALDSVDFSAAEAKFRKARSGIFLSARYSGEPHISGKREKFL